MSRADPKPGRWVLPLVVAGIIGFTYTFVNALPAADVPSATTVTSATTSSTTTTSTSTTTTTTIPPEVVAFLEVIDGFSAEAATLVDDAQRVNDEWDGRTITFSETRTGLGELRGRTDDFVAALRAAEFPSDAAALWSDVVESAEAMSDGADAMLDGLVNTEGSERRLAALEDYKAAEASVQQALDAAAAAVGG